MTDIYISYGWRIALWDSCSGGMRHFVKIGESGMRVEQQNANIVDVLQQSIGPE